MSWLGPRGSRFARSNVPVVDVGLQVPLREVGALATLHNAAHVEGSTLALFDALDWLGAAI